MKRTIKINAEIHNLFAKNLRKNIQEGGTPYPTCFLLGMNKQKTIVKAVNLVNDKKHYGCYNMIHVPNDTLTKAAIKILMKKLKICGVARVGRRFCTDDARKGDLYNVETVDDGGGEIGENNWLVVSYGRKGIEVHKFTMETYIKYNYAVVK